MSSVSAVPAVHKEMDQRTAEKEQIGNDAEHMGAVLLPQENSGDRREGAERDPNRPVIIPGLVVFKMCGHDQCSCRSKGQRACRMVFVRTTKNGPSLG